MAIEVTNNAGRFDRFKTKCPHCGRELSYARNNIRPHHRWPNGFLYCPGCKRPVGHSEDNIVEKGEDILRERAKQENVSVEDLEKQIRKLTVPKNVMFGIGIPLLVIGAVLFTLSLFNLFGENWLIKFIMFFGVFHTGLAMTITGGVLSGIITNKRLMIDSI